MSAARTARRNVRQSAFLLTGPVRANYSTTCLLPRGLAFALIDLPALPIKGFTFMPDERAAIFAAASIEKIIDNTGTYYALTITSEILKQWQSDVNRRCRRSE